MTGILSTVFSHSRPRRISRSERVQLSLSIDGKRHMLEYGSWTPGEFSSPLQNVQNPGTTDPVLTRVSETEWTVEASGGSVGRLWEISDPKKHVDVGLYRFSFILRFVLLPDIVR